jgi:hypothetical protein
VSEVVTMPVWLIVVIVVAAAMAFVLGGRIFSVVPDRLRRSDAKTAETVDQFAMSTRNPMALPMHDRSFDRPR